MENKKDHRQWRRNVDDDKKEDDLNQLTNQMSSFSLNRQSRFRSPRTRPTGFQYKGIDSGQSSWRRGDGVCTSNEHMSQQQRYSGWVTRWNVQRGFGFIREDNHHDDYFVHQSEVHGGQPLQERIDVEFDIVNDGNGRKKAVNVSVSQSIAHGKSPVSQSRNYRSAHSASRNGCGRFSNLW